MKNTIVRATLFCCLTAVLPVSHLFARGGGGGGGGAHVGGGGGGGAHIGGGAVGGGAPHAAGNAGAVHSPAFSAPNVGAHPAIGSNAGLRGSPGVNPGTNHEAAFRAGTSAPNGRGAAANTAVGNRNYTGNSVAIGNRNFNFANNAYRPSYYNHGFYHGYWNGNRFGPYGYGGYGYGAGYGLGGFGLGYGLGGYGLGYGLGYGYAPLGWGLAGWGLGSLLYNSGYLGYSNPYYGYGGGGGGGGVYNYSQPIPVAYNSSVVDNSGAAAGGQSADDLLNSAVDAFKQNDYDTALNLANTGVKQYPNDAVMHEFRALVLFAKGDYQQAAATIHSVLAVGPGWDWTTLSGLYTDISVYTTQLRSLEAAVRQRPDDGAARFLLAYHYMSDGYPDNATRQLQEVVKLVPNDRVASDLLRMLNAPKSTPNGQQAAAVSQPAPGTPGSPPALNEGATNVPSPSSPTVRPTETPIDPDAIVGSWNAAREDGSQFRVDLKKDMTFTWTFTPKQQKAQSFDGTYSIQGNILSLEQKGGGAMVAAIDMKDGQHFNFKPVGAPPEDPGLNFGK